MYDYIIVGAGSAGCLLANRLSKNPANQVLLLEAGPADKSPMIHMPGGSVVCLHSDKLNWKFESVPQAHVNDRVIPVPRGKTLGGSSAVNGMVYIRGHATDYDDWAAAGNKGWSFKEVLPYFKKSEANVRGESEFHGGSGELAVTNASTGMELFDMWVDACEQSGMSRNSDFNGAEQDGAGLYQVTIKDSVRCSSANAFLKPIKHRQNLTIITGADASRVLLENTRAVGVEYFIQGERYKALANNEVIISCGAIKSPHLLQLSGIGNAEDLSPAGIEQQIDLPGVGRNLQEHLDVKLNWSINKPITLNKLVRFPWNILVGMDYFFRKKGIAGKCGIEGGAFWRSNEQEERPDIQFHFVPANMKDLTDPLPKEHGVTVRGCNLRPEARGTIKPVSANHSDKPLVDFNFLDNEHDRTKLMSALKKARDIMKGEYWGGIVDGVITPNLDSQDDDVLREVIKDNCETVYHPVGTCKMGHDDMAVVDDRLRVHGVQGLRVCDASIMPTLIGGNTNAPTFMIAEKCADMVLADASANTAIHSMEKRA